MRDRQARPYPYASSPPAQGRGFPLSPFSLARCRASASAPPPDCAPPLRGDDAFVELRELSLDDPFVSLPLVSSSRRSVSAMRLRAASTSSTFTLTMSPGLTTSRG